MNDQKQHTQNAGTSHAESASHHESRNSEPSAYKTPRQVAEETLGHIDWIDEITGHLACPGEHLHTTVNGPRHCRVTVDGVPTVYCVHGSCIEELKKANIRLRTAFDANLVVQPEKRTAPFAASPVKADKDLFAAAASVRPWILKNFAWDVPEMRSQSPTLIPSRLEDHSGAYLKLYPAEDLLWIGDMYDSGTSSNTHWRTTAEWRDAAAVSPTRIGPFLCTASFKPGATHRSKDNIHQRRFFVVEFDRIDEVVDQKLSDQQPLTADDKARNKSKSGAVINLLRHAGLYLRAIVDSGNKSLHAHFEMPSEDLRAEVETILHGLGADTQSWRSAQPVRMPGFLDRATGREQRLLFLDLTSSPDPSSKTAIQLSNLIKGAAHVLQTDPPTVLPNSSGASFGADTDAGWENNTRSNSVSSGETSESPSFNDTQCPPSSSHEACTTRCSNTLSAGQENGAVNLLNSFTSSEQADIGTRESSPDSSASSNSFSPETAPIETTTTSSSNSSHQAPLPPVAASTTSSNSSFVTSGWPNPLAPAAFHGIAGKIVRMIEPHTEADPAALLIHLLTAVGNIVGRNVFITADGALHHLNLFAAIVGVTSKGRKGTAWNQVARLVSRVDEVWKNERITTGLSSGEGVIWAVRDAIVERKPAKGPQARAGDIEEVTKDPGVDDKRLFVVEGELANTLKVMAREGNTLSPILRQAWDGNDLNTLVKNSPAKSTAPHISIVGHITKEELLLLLRAVEAANGFANRFLWTATKRSQLLPEGGAIDGVNFNAVILQLHSIIEFAKSCGEVRRAESARQLWQQVYRVLSEGKPGMVGAITGRAEAQVMRLSAIYAVLDQSKLIMPVHHEAAMAVWRYSEETVRWIFGDKTGDKDADKILAALRRAGSMGLSRTDISKNVFTNNKSAFELDEALQKLMAFDFAKPQRVHVGKVTEERWVLQSEVRF